jgi:hypothetical protein
MPDRACHPALVLAAGSAVRGANPRRCRRRGWKRRAEHFAPSRVRKPVVGRNVGSGKSAAILGTARSSLTVPFEGDGYG